MHHPVSGHKKRPIRGHGEARLQPLANGRLGADSPLDEEILANECATSRTSPTPLSSDAFLEALLYVQDMAKRTETITHYVDDLDGSSYDEGYGDTIKFALDNASFEIDLNEKNAKEFRKLFAPYVQKARVAARSTTTSSTRTRNSKEDLAVIRTWANANGHNVSSRGRVPKAIVEEYKASS